MKEIIIPKEHAVFWMDSNGVWKNAHGRFRNKKIIDHFNASIRKDDGGYYVTQQNGEILEKVYFHYMDTALFVADVRREPPVALVLNTGKILPLAEGDLFIKNDGLYVRTGDEIARFTDRGLLAISPFLEENGGRCCIRIDGRRREIPREIPQGIPWTDQDFPT